MELSCKLAKSVVYDPSTGVLEIETRPKGNRKYFSVPRRLRKPYVAESPGWYHTRYVGDVFPRTAQAESGQRSRGFRLFSIVAASFADSGLRRPCLEIYWFI